MEMANDINNRIILKEGKQRRRQLMLMFYKYVREDVTIIPTVEFEALLDKIKVLRNGLHLGTIKKDRFEPNHALAMYLSKNEVKTVFDMDYNDNLILDYLKGVSINKTTQNKGYVLVCVNGISVGWGKDDGRIIKNLYPKGLRVN